jgi:acetylornithine deacetylase/succinyl-diaminopimelate desuccinylase-like protein
MALDLEPSSTTASTSLTDSERQIMEEIARRRDELVTLASDLIAFDTTAREHNDDPAREEAALQKYLAARLRAAGAETDLWEPVPEDIAGSPMTPPGLRFDGRPQLVARFPGVGGGRSLCSTVISMWSNPIQSNSGPVTLFNQRCERASSTVGAPAT